MPPAILRFAGATANGRIPRPASKTLEPEWLSVAATEKALVSIDCSEEKQLCRDYDVASYPALRFFDGHGTMTRYRGPRTAASYVPTPLILPLSAACKMDGRRTGVVAKPPND